MIALTFIYLIISMVNTEKSTVYSFNVNNLQGETVHLNQYKGKVLLIVNTASECGFAPQLKDLEKLYGLYKNKGFEVLAFPSNDFGGQEPLQGEAIGAFCAKNFHVTFPVFDKIHVKGVKAHPLFKFLSNKSQNGKVNVEPKWNFQKYLIDRNGNVYDYYLSFTNPTSAKIKKAIEKLL